VALRQKYFLFLLTMHSSLLLTSTVAGSKVFALPFGLTASATVLSYSLTFVILDSIAELYGREHSRFVIILGLLGMFVCAAYIGFAVLLPPAEFWKEQDAFAITLGSSWRIWLGGWSAYMVGQYVDLWSFLKLREVGGQGVLALRAWVSMLVAQLLDTIIFVTIAFYGSDPISSIIAGQYLVKLVIAAFASPAVPIVVWFGRRLMGEEDTAMQRPTREE
jgi:hypothetical protein